MTVVADREYSDKSILFEDVMPGIHANGFGYIGDGRSFAFHTERNQLVVEVYRPRLSGPVPHPEDVVAVAVRGLTDIDVTDERSLMAAVRDAVADAAPVGRPGSKPAR
jgi:hypothetical protein